MKKLRLDLDSWCEQPFSYTEYDIGGEGHAIIIKAEDKEKFLDAFAREIREQVADLLEEYDEEDDDE